MSARLYQPHRRFISGPPSRGLQLPTIQLTVNTFCGGDMLRGLSDQNDSG
jgi:hypothetical protein